MQGWHQAYRREEDTLRDANGFIMLDNPHEYGKITEIWKKGLVRAKADADKKTRGAKKPPRDCEADKTDTDCAKSGELKVKFFETFDQMTQHMKEKGNKRATGQSKEKSKAGRGRRKEKSEKSRQKSNEEEQKSSHSVSESRRRSRRTKKKRKESMSNKYLMKENLEDHQAQKITFLTEKLERQNRQFLEYSRRVEEALRSQILTNEAHLKQQRRRQLCLAKERLGEYMLRGGMAKTKEVWVDRGEMKHVKQRLARVKREKELREKFRKTLKRRKNSTVTSEEINSGELMSAKESKRGVTQGTQMNSSNANLAFSSEPVAVEPVLAPGLLFNPHMSPQSNVLSSFDRSSQGSSQINQYEFSFEEAKDLVNMQITFLNKEEGILKDRLEILEMEKRDYLRTLRRVYDEENCRFGSRFKPVALEGALWSGVQQSATKPANAKMSISNPDTVHSLQTQSWPLLNKRYQLVSLLGKGGFSEVYKAYDLKRMRYVACKIHQLNPHWSLASRSNYIRYALRENQVHRFLKHLNIVEHYDSVEIDSNSFCTILEFCNGPSLSSYLKTHKTLSEKEAKMIVRQILSGLLFLNQKHEAKIIHYDLKPQNILFNNGIPKISDFGLCKVMNNDDTKLELTSQGVGTYYYLPPECFIRDRENPILISTKVDIWSLGVIFFEMLYGFRPFGHNLSQERIFKDGIMLKAHSVTFPNRPNVSEDTKNFIRKALAYHQEDRIDVPEAHRILHSKWTK